MSDDGQPVLEDLLHQMISKLPGSVRYRSQNAVTHLDRADRMLESDREIASFLAITAEEEAATALIKAVQLRRYPSSGRLNAWSHQHKAAVIACIMAIASEIQSTLSKFHIKFDFDKKRIDVLVPISNFGVTGGDDIMLQPTEPLALVHSKPDTSEEHLFDTSLETLAKSANFEGIKQFVSSQANARNRLLYASDSSLPQSQATRESLAGRRRWMRVMLSLTVMVLQSRERLPFVCAALSAFLNTIAKLPRDQTAD